MKKNKFIGLALTVLLAYASTAMFTGCTTTPSGTTVVDPLKAQKIAPVLRITVSGAVIYGYMRDKNSVKYLDVVKATLQEFILSNDLSPANLQAKIFALPVKELKTPEAQLIITPLLAAYKAYAEEYVRNGLVDQVGWKILVKALTDGIDDGLEGVAQIKVGGG